MGEKIITALIFIVVLVAAWLGIYNWDRSPAPPPSAEMVGEPIPVKGMPTGCFAFTVRVNQQTHQTVQCLAKSEPYQENAQ